MNKKTLLKIGGLIAGAGLIVLMLTLATPARGQPQAPSVWPGYWQMGPSLNTAPLGCTAGDGLARFTGIYYPTTNKIYFLGGRCETDTITVGRVFTFDPVSQTFAATSTVMPTPVSNYTMARVENDGRGHGVGFYIVGGRKQDASQTNAVQVYYPDDGTTFVDAANPFPPATPYSPGSVQVVNDKLYVFGGFDGTNMYATTYIYDPNAPSGSRWTNSGCDLPTGRSYISGVVIGTKIYAIGGDEIPTLTAIDDTEVLDTANLGACWSDSAMADLPSANDNTQAVYVDEGFLAGGIYMVGGGWAAPGPYRWVFRYDVATDTWDDTFPQLVVPSPATGRRNFALVYVPPTAIAGIGTGIPGMWAFGGYDGSGTNAQTETSEYFSYLLDPVTLIPQAVEVVGLPGTTVPDNFTVQNNTLNTDSYTLTVASDVTWNYSIPGSVGPVDPNGGQAPFPFSVDIPGNVSCPTTGVFTVTATSVLSPTLTAVQAVSVRAACGIGGTVTDANTGDPLSGALAYAYSNTNYYSTYTDLNGHYTLFDVPPDSYLVGSNAMHYVQAPEVPVVISNGSAIENFALTASVMAWSPDDWTISLPAGSAGSSTLTISNTGSAPLYYSISVLDGSEATPPPSTAAMPVPGLPRIDPQLVKNLTESNTADFVVVLTKQADLSAAPNIKDWNARGEYVYKTLSDFADQNQVSLRSFLTSSGAKYTPLYIINAIIVRGGSMNLVNSLAARNDVAQIIANRQYKVENSSWVDQMMNMAGPEVPETVGWNIAKVNAPGVWALGYNGAGMVVANVNSGVQWDHPALKSHYRGWNGTVANHNYNWYDPVGDYPLVPGDGSGHGTHTMGTMVGDDISHINQIGMAPGAKWMACKAGIVGTNFLDGNALLVCAQWMIAPTDLNGNNPDPSMRPDVVNNSWGGGTSDYWYQGAVDAWKAAGIFPVFSNGNDGPLCATSHSPGDYWNTFSAGATDSTDTIAAFSSRGPTTPTELMKPQISAPGVSVRSSVPTNAYANYDGTSMASPHISGAVALLWSADPELIGQIYLTGWILEQSAHPLYTTEGCGGDTPTSRPNNVYGWGRLDVLAAVNLAKAGGVTPDWLSVDPMGGVVNPGETAQVALDFETPVTPGVYTATLWLVADDPYNSDLRLPVELTAENVPPMAAFTSNSPVQLGSAMQFTNLTTGTEPITYLWTFGDGITSTETSPTHTFAALGTYTVTLAATNVVDTDVVSHNVEVVGIPPQVSIVTPPPVMAGEAITFTAVVSGTGPFDYVWNFGDGITSTEATPSHTYVMSGTYTVTVDVTTEWGTATFSIDVVVNAPEVTMFNVYLPVVRKAP